MLKGVQESFPHFCKVQSKQCAFPVASADEAVISSVHLINNRHRGQLYKAAVQKGSNLTADTAFPCLTCSPLAMFNGWCVSI